MLEKFFKLKENNTTIRTEFTAGLTTFLTMAYIVVVNPAILHSAGVPFEQVFMATIITAIVGSLMMGLLANYPIAIAPGMGLNAYFASVVATQGLSYQTVFGTVFIAGILFLLLSLTTLRETLINKIPNSLKFGITAGIGLFIAFVGLKNSGLVVPNETNIIGMGDLTDPMVMLTIVGLFLTLVFYMLNIRGALFLGMILTGILAYFTGQIQFEGVISAPPAPVFFDLDIAGVFSHGLYTVVIAFLLVTLFDTTGTIIGVAEQGGFMKDGKLPRSKQALMADATATTVGSVFGTSPATAYIESTSGVAAGGRTGLTSFFVSLLFALSIFFTPIISVVANVPAITSPVLIIVGSFMMQGLAKIDWKSFDEAFPTFITMIAMPFTASIATGIAVGFITYPLMKLARGKGKEVHWLIYLFALLFLLQLLFFPMNG
ncbi:NCS2 family permease [Oceanobacillus alkalisoli]|uniref:NCS2 family permease n=1 Tax=Oceanobacillus alkalisoli TaxID=2925113 RepID=UPI001EF10BF4|nr:NCS2 family permease [Oceanobacillus alkalisoli]MCF3943375.1 NCS2 family permease [Oceanobacillus alkalisoli]MCG5103964.1 NCS2 family permease [Oceanobacillus alkalisoli]